LSQFLKRYIYPLSFSESSRVEYDYNIRCPNCHVVKPRLEFHKRNINFKGLPVCNNCQVKLLLKKYIESRGEI